MNVISQDAFAKIAVNKSLLKEYSSSKYQRVVYLNDGDEFQIQLFNPLSVTIGADISINDIYFSNRLIIKPGERIWLERYLDSPDKFIFSTYTVNGNNSEVKEAIKNNGIIKIKFYKENKPIQIASSPICNYNDNNYIYKFTTTCDNTSALGSSNISTSSIDTPSSSFTTTSCYAVLSSNTIETANYIKPKQEKNIETGRIERGSHSNQSFDYVNIYFEYWSFKTETIHILPKSQKQYSSSDLEKKYCPECGRKIKDKFKFCPFCGNKL